MNIIKLKENFRKHVEKYDIKDPKISLKLYHSYRVMELCQNISKYYKFNEEDLEIAILIGLLHDYARFEQWHNYGTFNDKNSIDHGDLAVERLFKNNEINNFCSNKNYYDIIYNAIKYHNKYSIPANLDKKNELMCKLIRDADKLDIFYLYSIDKNLILEDNKEISTKVNEYFYNNELISFDNITNKSESIILKLSMVFNLNFKFSYIYLYETNLIDKIYQQIDNKEKFKPYFEYIKKYIQRNIR